MIRSGIVTMSVKTVHNRKDACLKTTLMIMAFSAALLLGLIIVFLFGEAWPLFAYLWHNEQWLALFKTQG